MNSRASITDVARNFSDYIDRVTHQGETFVLMRGGKAVAELRPLSAGQTLGDLAAFLASAPRLGEENAAAFAAELEEARAELNAAPLRDPWDS